DTEMVSSQGLNKELALQIPKAAFVQLHVMVVVNYILPWEWLQLLAPQKWAMIAFLPCTAALLALPFFEKRGEPAAKPPLSWMLGLSVGVLFVLVYLGRPSVVEFYRYIGVSNLNAMRYSILQGVLFALAVVVSLAHTRSTLIKRAYFAVLV